MIDSQLIKDVLAAGCLGDAYGYPVEFLQWDVIEKRYGPKGLMELLNNPNYPVATDDTQMTLFAIEGIVNAFRHGTPSKLTMREEAKESFINWYYTQHAQEHAPDSLLKDFEELLYRRAPGNTCLSAMADHCSGIVKHPQNNSKGCGAVMRAAPYGLLADKLSYDDIWTMAAHSGAITHGHVEGYGSGAALAYLIAHLVKGVPLREAISETLQACDLHGISRTGELMAYALTLSGQHLDPEALCDLLGEGWVGEEALAISVYAALRASTVLEAIQIGANHRGDSDSTASIAGQIAAAALGGISPAEREMYARVDLEKATTFAANLLVETLNSR